MSKIIITCAITGSIHTPTMSDALPYRPEDIADQAIEAAQAGASILHLHARDPGDGRPSADPHHWMRFLPRIKAGCDSIVNMTTGGSAIMTLDGGQGYVTIAWGIYAVVLLVLGLRLNLKPPDLISNIEIRMAKPFSSPSPNPVILW